LTPAAVRQESILRAAVRSVLPPRTRRALRIALRELPNRLRDALPDFLDRMRGGAALPPPGLRMRVGIDSSRKHFDDIGRAAAVDILAILDRSGVDRRTLGPWLDYGCGCGRVARHLHARGVEVWGVDIDGDAIRWCQEHLSRERFFTVAPTPPTQLSDGSFDLIYSVSVFTHLDEAAQFAWLAELRRLLRPGGVLVASTHSPELVYNRPDMALAQHEQLRDHGFAFVGSEGPFNDDSAFHSPAYLQREWSPYFTMLRHEAAGLVGYQDLSVWRR
jgi:SAM-dependent methyltransferase